ncbi:MAG: hypothetical protein V2A73_19985, partial [Pseudomonadota bacterium]
PFIGVPCHRRAADCCGENSTSKEEWNKELGTRHREQHNQRLLFTPVVADRLAYHVVAHVLATPYHNCQETSSGQGL